MSPTVAQVMVEQLVKWQVKCVFGVVGDGIFYLMDALARNDQITFYAVRHEETAALMASAYAKYTGRPGVCLGTSGPGFMHLFNGLADAYKDRVPVIAITGQVARADIGTGKKQYIDQQNLISPLVGYSSLLADPSATIKLMSAVYRTSVTQNIPTHISVPADVFNLPCNNQSLELEPYLFTTARTESNAIQDAISILNGAKRPVILAGVGARKAAGEVLMLAEKWGAGVIHTLGSVGVIPGEHPLALGGLGHAGSKAAQDMLNKADLCFRIGVNWWPKDYTPGSITVVELDNSPANIGIASPVRFGIAGDAKEVLPAITNKINKVESNEWTREINQAHEEWLKAVEKESSIGGMPVHPARLIKAMNRVLKPDSVICLDTGDHTIWFGRNFVPKEQSVLLSGKWRTMGFGPAAGLAVKILDPKKQVVVLTGDGGMGMLLAEFTTAVMYNLPIVIIVVNNGGLIEEKNRMMVGNLIPEGVALHNPDFAMFAKACGGEGIRVDNADILESKLAEVLSLNKPVIVDVNTRQDMVPGTKMM